MILIIYITYISITLYYYIYYYNNYYHNNYEIDYLDYIKYFSCTVK